MRAHSSLTIAAILAGVAIRSLSFCVGVARADAEQLTPTSRPCFGAASHDPQRPCSDPALRRMVFPTPRDVAAQSSPRCATVVKTTSWWICAMGAPAGQARASIALLGDSHAGHWRPAVGAFARSAGLRAMSITRSGCPFSAATPDLLRRRRRHQCERWRRHVLGWLAGHPEISTDFVGAHAGARLVLPRGRTQFAAKAAAYARQWRRLPATVKHVIVIRDVPKSSHAALACVTAAIAHRRRAGSACASPRRTAVVPDPAVAAARSWRGRGLRVRVLDFTRFFCGRRRCDSVIGGALVHKDETHLTAEFAESLGPSFTREVAALSPALALLAAAVERDALVAISGDVSQRTRPIAASAMRTRATVIPTHAIVRRSSAEAASAEAPDA